MFHDLLSEWREMLEGDDPTGRKRFLFRLQKSLGPGKLRTTGKGPPPQPIPSTKITVGTGAKKRRIDIGGSKD